MTRLTKAVMKRAALRVATSQENWARLCPELALNHPLARNRQGRLRG
jgi:hypothetical protein